MPLPTRATNPSLRNTSASASKPRAGIDDPAASQRDRFVRDPLLGVARPRVNRFYCEPRQLARHAANADGVAGAAQSHTGQKPQSISEHDPRFARQLPTHIGFCSEHSALM